MCRVLSNESRDKINTWRVHSIRYDRKLFEKRRMMESVSAEVLQLVVTTEKAAAGAIRKSLPSAAMLLHRILLLKRRTNSLFTQDLLLIDISCAGAELISADPPPTANVNPAGVLSIFPTISKYVCPACNCGDSANVGFKPSCGNDLHWV